MKKVLKSAFVFAVLLVGIGLVVQSQNGGVMKAKMPVPASADSEVFETSEKQALTHDEIVAMKAKQMQEKGLEKPQMVKKTMTRSANADETTMREKVIELNESLITSGANHRARIVELNGKQEIELLILNEPMKYRIEN